MSVKVWKLEREKILTKLKDWAFKLAEQDEKVLSVVLFGSIARGDQTGASDADLLIILQDSPLAFEERIPQYKLPYPGISTDIFPYTVEEIKKALLEGWGTAGIALKEGIYLFKRKGSTALACQNKSRGR